MRLKGLGYDSVEAEENSAHDVLLGRAAVHLSLFCVVGALPSAAAHTQVLLITQRAAELVDAIRTVSHFAGGVCGACDCIDVLAGQVLV